MSRSYFSQDQKLVSLTNQEPWSIDDCYCITDILYGKGYFVNCVSRIGADKKWHDSWHIKREDAPKLVEQLFRQRLVAEFEAEGHDMAAVIFSYDYPAETIISAVKRFQKNNRGDSI